MDSGSTHLHVVPSLDGGWTVRESADGRALKRTPTRRGVLDHATLVLARRTGGKITVHASDGTITERYDVRALGKRGWWYSPRGWTSIYTPVVMTVLPVRWALEDSSLLPRWLAVAAVAVGLLSVTSVVASRWVDRRRGPLAEKVRTAGG